MSITTETLTVIDRYRAATGRIIDDHTRYLTAAWVEAWGTVADEFDDALTALTSGKTPPTARQVRRSVKLAAALDAIGAQLDDLARQTGVTIVGTLPSAVELAGTAHVAMLTTQAPPGSGAGIVTAWNRVDKDAIAAIIARTTGQVHASTWPLSDSAVASMRRNLLRGLVTGDNPRDTARRMLADTRGTFNGGLSRALTLARTETLDAMRAAAALADQANADVTKQWEWVATLSTRTCPACWGMHGRQFPTSTPGPLGHQNCRCTRVPVLNTWTDLGFDGVDEPPPLMPDAEATFAGLPAADQAAILGPARFRAWQAGNYPMSAWATRVDTPGWRPSYRPSKAPTAA